MDDVAVGDRVLCRGNPATVIRVRPYGFFDQENGCVVQYDNHDDAGGVEHFGIPGTWWVRIGELVALDKYSDLPLMDA